MSESDHQLAPDRNTQNETIAAEIHIGLLPSSLWLFFRWKTGESVRNLCRPAGLPVDNPGPIGYETGDAMSGRDTTDIDKTA
jgi:hypothetical protein